MSGRDLRCGRIQAGWNVAVLYPRTKLGVVDMESYSFDGKEL